jgi:hypothetical protein
MLDLKKRRKMKREGVRRNERIHMQSLRVDACDSACFVFAAKLTSHMQPGRLLTFLLTTLDVSNFHGRERLQ